MLRWGKVVRKAGAAHSDRSPLVLSRQVSAPALLCFGPPKGRSEGSFAQVNVVERKAREKYPPGLRWVNAPALSVGCVLRKGV